MILIFSPYLLEGASSVSRLPTARFTIKPGCQTSLHFHLASFNTNASEAFRPPMARLSNKPSSIIISSSCLTVVLLRILVSKALDLNGQDFDLAPHTERINGTLFHPS